MTHCFFHALLWTPESHNLTRNVDYFRTRVVSRRTRFANRCVQRNTNLAVVLIFLGLVVLHTSGGLTGDVYTSSLKCLQHGSCLLENIFLDMNGTFHYYIPRMSDLTRVES